MDMVIAAFFCMLGACVVIALIFHLKNIRKTHESASLPDMAIHLAHKPSLIVMVFDHNDDEVSILVTAPSLGDPVNMKDVSYAAAYLSGLAAKNCEDGMERGFEYIQEDAVRLHSQ